MAPQGRKKKAKPSSASMLVAAQPEPLKLPITGLLSRAPSNAEVASEAARKPEEKRTAATENITVTVSPEQRHRMISQEAYRRAVVLGLGHTDPFQDWLIAEREVDAKIASGT